MPHLLTHYEVSVRKGGEEELLGDFAEGNDLAAFLMGALQRVDVTDENKSLAISGDVVRHGRNVDALLEVGEAGVRSQLRKGTGDAVERLPEDHETMKAFVLCRVPGGGRRGDVVVHQPHGRGIKGLLHQHLKDEFNGQFPQRDLTLQLNPAVSDDALRALYEQGAIERVRLVRRRQPVDRFERIGDYVDPEEVGALETHLVSKRGRVFSKSKRIEDVIYKAGGSRDTLVLEGVEYEQMKVDLDLGGGKRKVVVVEPELTAGRLSYEVDEELTLVDGEPTRESLRKAATGLVEA